MKRLQLLMLCNLLLVSANADPKPGPPGAKVETLVCIRHGEKPPGGFGQLNCQGLNRALALPPVLLGKYGPPQFLFAPNPSSTILDPAGIYDYVRPLATIEPTAIYCGLPVNTQFAYQDIADLEAELKQDTYQKAVVYIAWEHLYLVAFVQGVVQAYGGNVTQVPAWPDDDYDTIFVVRITRIADKAFVSFTVDHEGLNNLSSHCPMERIRPLEPGLRTNHFGFLITGTSNALVVVEASTNLADPTWSPVGTNILHGNASYFHDPLWTNYSSRFYRLTPP